MLVTNARERPTAGIVKEFPTGEQLLQRRHLTGLLPVLGVEFGDESVYVHHQ